MCCRFARFEGYNDWKKKKMKKPQLSARNLEIQSEILFRMINRPYTQNWGDIKTDSEKLAVSLSTYATFLKSSCDKQQARQQQLYPPRLVVENVWIEHKAETQAPVKPEYAKLDVALAELDDYQTLFFDAEVHSDLTPHSRQLHRLP